MTQQDMATRKQNPIPTMTLRSEQASTPWPVVRDNDGDAFAGYSSELVLDDIDARRRSRNGHSPIAAGTPPAPTEPLARISVGPTSPATALPTLPQTLPLSIAQRGIWVAQKIGSVGAVFNIAENIEIHGPIDPELFDQALRQVTTEAEAIRIKVIDTPEGPRQIITPSFDDEFPYFDVSDAADPRRAAEAWMMRELTKPVDFACDPLWVSALFKAAPDRYFWYHRSHHINFDGFTGGMIGRRVAELYTALVEGRPPVPHQFGPLQALLDNERDYRASDRFERDRAYWRDHLADLPDAVSFAKKRVAGPIHLFRKTGTLSPASTTRLHEIAKDSAGSLPQILISLAATFMYRTTGAKDLVFGMPVTGRPSGQLRRTPGMVANAVPIRLAMSPDLTLAQLIKQVASQVRQALRHQQYRYEDLRRDLGLVGIDRQISWLGVNIEPFDYDLRFGGHQSTTHNLSNGSVEDLMIFIYDRDDGQGLRIDFDAHPALYKAEELTEHLTRFLRLIDAILDQPDLPIGRIDLLDPQERCRLLIDWNDTGCPVDNRPLVAQFEARVQATPDAIAVSAETVDLDYRTLNALANFWAHTLIDRGIGPGDLVALAVPRTELMPVALLAILKAGAAYVPIDPSHPAERLAMLLSDAQPALVLTTAALAKHLPREAPASLLLDHPVASIDLARFALRNPTDADRMRVLTPSDTAYVIFTSGSTGRPKGVVVSHGNLANLLAAMRAELGFDAADRLLAVTTLAFDIAALEIYVPLLAGGRVVVAPEHVVRDPDDLAQLIRRAGITIMQATPSLWQSLCECHEDAVRGLRILVGGEALPSALARRLKTLGASVTNLYGPTETTVWSTSARVEVPPADATGLEAPPIGRPIWNTQTYVLDAGLEPVPVGIAGDLYIAGAGVADGYLNRPGLTAERFIANPYGPPGSRLYRTGDLARRQANGVLDYLGRTDHQVKIRGFRIETDEIETALQRSRGVLRAVVTALDGLDGGKRLVAYLVPIPGVTLNPSELRKELATRIPDYMIPAAFVMLDALPLTLNGKIDRKALPLPERRVVPDHVAPRTTTELRLAALFAAELGIERIGIHDNFFEMGGDSLMAARLIAKIQKAFAVEITLAALFTGSTIADLAAWLDGQGTGNMFDVLLPLRIQGKGAPLFCIHPIIGLGWSYAGFLRHIGADHPVYALQSRGLKGPEALPASLDEMAEDYLQQIRRIQPHGPYHLAGWSLGGLVAFAMARRLRDEGETVGFLALLDAYPFVQLPPGQEPAEAELVEIAMDFLGFDRMALGAEPPLMSSLAHFLIQQYDLMSIPLVRQMQEKNSGFFNAFITVVGNNLALARRFRPPPVDADLLLFRATQGKPRDLAAKLEHHTGAWTPHISGQIVEYEIDCRHQEMMSPGQIDEIARILAREFAERVRVADREAAPCA
jgi:enterobactin synthetase component F